MKFPSSSAYAQEDAPEAFEAFLNNGSAQNLLPAEPPQKSNYEDIILLVYYPVARLTLSEVGSAPFIRQLIAWLSRPNILTEIPEQSQFDLDLESGDPRTVNSTYDKCKIFYGCLYYVLTEALIQGRPSAEYPEGLYPFSMIDLQDCISTAYNYTLVCPILLYDVGALHEQEDPCISGGYECTIETWDAAGTDPNLQIFIQSGRDSEGLWWQGPKVVGERVYDNTSDTYITAWWPPESRSFSVALGRQALGYVGTECSLESPCLPDIDCKDTGSHIALGLGQGVYPEAWVECAIAAAKNINQQLSNQYVAIKGAAIVATLQTFRIQDFFPDPNKSFGLLNALQGLASAFAIIGGFVPGFSSKTLSLASTGVSAIGSFLGRYISDSAGPLIPQENYAENVATIYVSLVDGLDTAAELLFNGSSIDGGFNLTDMMKGGIWANVDSLERVSDIENQLRIEIISRSINALWKTPTSNKMFVLFVDLGDDDAATKCNADVSGPGDLRYCGDGGVYYTYNFIESGEGIGYLGWPWGADKLQAELRIDPAVSQRIWLCLVPPKSEKIVTDNLYDFTVDNRSLSTNLPPSKQHPRPRPFQLQPHKRHSRLPQPIPLLQQPIPRSKQPRGSLPRQLDASRLRRGDVG